MSETLSFFVMQLTLIAVVLVLHVYLGLHIIKRTIIFCDLALDQLAALGALVGLGIGIAYGSVHSYLLSLVAVLFGAFLLAVIKPTSRSIPQEAVIGIIYALALVASLLLGDKLSGGGAYVAKTLTGSMLWVSWRLIVVTTVAYSILTSFHYRFRHRFLALAEESKGGDRLWDFLFFTTQGIITVLIVPIAGVLLAYAFLMIPAAISIMFTTSWTRGVIVGWVAGFAACALGLVVSYYGNFPYGPTLIMALGLLFISAVIVRYVMPQRS